MYIVRSLPSFLVALLLYYLLCLSVWQSVCNTLNSHKFNIFLMFDRSVHGKTSHKRQNNSKLNKNLFWFCNDCVGLTGSRSDVTFFYKIIFIYFLVCCRNCFPIFGVSYWTFTSFPHKDILCKWSQSFQPPYCTTTISTTLSLPPFSLRSQWWV